MTTKPSPLFVLFAAAFTFVGVVATFTGDISSSRLAWNYATVVLWSRIIVYEVYPASKP